MEQQQQQKSTIHMVGGAGDSSYASNSTVPKGVIMMMKSMVEDAIREVYRIHQPKMMLISDLGCASGPNTFVAVSNIISTLSREAWKFNRRPPPELLVFLNDLPGNDFNTTFQSLPEFENKLKEDTRPDNDEVIVCPHYVAGLPGSFYNQLFPAKSVHFFHSSFAIMWLSQAPKELAGMVGGEQYMNRGNIYIGKTSPPMVEKLYQKQFRDDFSQFLKFRFIELIPGGQMVLIFPMQKDDNVTMDITLLVYQFLSESLSSMVAEGMVEVAKLDGFNMPLYYPKEEDVMAAIQQHDQEDGPQQLFEIVQLQKAEMNLDPSYGSELLVDGDCAKGGERIAKAVRAFTGPVLESQFGTEIMDDLYSRYAAKMAEHLASEGKITFAVMSLVLKKRAH